MQTALKRLPDAELEVMKALWDAGRPLTRPELDTALRDRNWAATTVLGLLSRLEGKGFLTRQRQGRGYLYAPAVPRETYLAVEGRSALGRMFAGSAKNLVAALHECDALSREEVDELAAYLETLKRGDP